MSAIIKSREDELLELQSIDTEVQAINTNGAKEAKQDTMITALGSIETAINNIEAGGGTASTDSSVAASATSVSLLAANANRVEVYIRNASNKKMYVALGATATVNQAIELNKGDIFHEENYTGAISAIWEAAPTGNARITEVTTS